MKKVSLVIIGLLFVTKIFSQNDSIDKSSFWIRPYIENGITFLNNNNLKETYGTNSMYNWGFGVQIGNPNKRTILPYFQFTNSSYAFQKTNLIGVRADTALKIREFMIGLNVSVLKFNSNVLSAKAGYIISIINDGFHKNSNNANGLQVGIGYEAKIFRNSGVYINYTYDFLKLNNASFRDYDIQKISFGLIL